MKPLVFMLIGLGFIIAALLAWVLVGDGGDDEDVIPPPSAEPSIEPPEPSAAARTSRSARRRRERSDTPLTNSTDATDPTNSTDGTSTPVELNGGGVRGRLDITRTPGENTLSAPVAVEVVELPKGWRDRPKDVIDAPRSRFFSFAGFAKFGNWRSLKPLARLDLDSKSHAMAHIAVRDPVAGEVAKKVRYRTAYLAGGTTDAAVLELAGQRATIIEGDLRGVVKVSGQQFIHVTGNLEGRIEGGGQVLLEVRGDLNGDVKLTGQVSLRIGGDVNGRTELGTILGADFGGRVEGERKWTAIGGMIFWRRHAMLADIEALHAPHGNVLHLLTSDLTDGEHEHVGGWRVVHVNDPLWQKVRSVRD